MKLLLRIKYDNEGRAIGFYAGGPTNRGMSLKNIQKYYRKALILGGMTELESHKFSLHGAKRAHVTFAKNFGAASDGDVVLGTKHAHGGTVSIIMTLQGHSYQNRHYFRASSETR